MIRSLDIPRDADAPRIARSAVAECLRDDRLSEDAALLLSELVTNSVRHGGGPTVRVILDTGDGGDSLRCEVIDQGGGFAPGDVTEHPGGAGGGWGLPLVEAVSCAWGTGDDATRVWFELGDPPRS